MTRSRLRLDAPACVSFALAVLAPSALAQHSFPVPSGGLRDGGRLETAGQGDCISPAQRAAVRHEIERYQRREGEYADYPVVALSASSSLLYTQYPLGGTLYDDLWTSNFVDLDPGAGVLDWDCGAQTYDGHQGSDVLIRSFGEQAVGVPIYSALDGVVIGTDDGHPDMNLVWAGQPANYVIVDHGSGRIVYYWHMKTGSVAVSNGQAVKAGQQLGEVGSSGISNWPHLHFESHQGGSFFEPYTGSCNPGTSAWKEQEPIDYSSYLWEFAVTDQDLTTFSPPNEFPRGGQVTQAAASFYFWLNWINLPASSTWRVRIYRPNGTEAFDSGTFGFGNPSVYTYSWWWWNYNIPEMTTTPGTWRVDLDINGVQAIAAPFEVVPTISPANNHAPEPVTVSLDPPDPSALDVLMCRVDSPLGLDDHDYDLLRYTYEWKVNGSPVRTVTTAGKADALPRLTARAGDLVSCDVTVGDGLASAPVASASVVVSSLVADVEGLSLLLGGQQHLCLDATSALASAFYWMFGSVTGMVPGIDFGGGVVLPLNFDVYMNLTIKKPGLGVFGGFQGFLDADGLGGASFNLPAGADPGLAGATLYHAYVAGLPIGTAQFASNATTLTLLP